MMDGWNGHYLGLTLKRLYSENRKQQLVSQLTMTLACGMVNSCFLWVDIILLVHVYYYAFQYILCYFVSLGRYSSKSSACGWIFPRRGSSTPLCSNIPVPTGWCHSLVLLATQTCPLSWRSEMSSWFASKYYLLIL